jgi:ankyrin repeat protein
MNARIRTTLFIFLLGASSGSALAGAGAAEVADAAQNRNIDALRVFLTQKRSDVNATQADGTTALHWAAHWNDLEAVTLLLKAGANVKAVNRYGVTPLSEAVVSGNVALVEALLAAGADPKTLSTEDGETVLMTAARAGNKEVVSVLLVRGADVNAREGYKGQTALMWAAAEGHVDVINLLMAHGADWRVRNFDRETKVPRLSAASSISPIPRGGFTALLFAARNGDIESAKALLGGGADINYGDVDNTSAMVVAIMNKQFTFAKFMLDRGADPDMIDAAGRTAVYAVVDIRNEDWSTLPQRKTEDPLTSLDFLKQLLDRGANPNLALSRPLPGRSGMDSGDTGLGAGTTPLMRAARSGDAAAMKLLLEKGANPKLTSRDGNNALLIAAGVGYRDKYTRGTDEEALAALKVAIAAGLDINSLNQKGENALHGAASRGSDLLVQFLVDNGVNINTKTRQGGATPLDVAMGKGSFGLPVPHESTVALIKKLGGTEGGGPAGPAGFGG